MTRLRSVAAPEKVVSLDVRRGLDTVEALEALLAHARAGMLQGVVVAWRTRSGRTSASVTGSLRDDPALAAGIAMRAAHTILTLEDEAEQ